VGDQNKDDRHNDNRYEYDLQGQFHEIWEFFNGYTLEEHRFEIHR
jgi:hypothetical protein